MVEVRQYDIRPQPRQLADAELRDAFRVYMSPEAMKSEKITQGDWVTIQSVSNPQLYAIGLAWRFQENNAKSNCIKMHDCFRTMHGFEMKDKLTISKYQGEIKRIQEIIISDVTEEGKPLAPCIESNEDLEFCAAVALYNFEAIGPGFTFEAMPRAGSKKSRKRRFLIDQILPETEGASGEPNTIPHYFDRNSHVQLRDSTTPLLRSHPPPSLEVTFEGLWGLDRQLQQLNHILSKISEKLVDTSQLRKLNHNKPILIHGPPGTGKTEILKQLKAGPWTKTFEIDEQTLSPSKEKRKAALSKLFTDARVLRPSLIAIDDIDLIVGNSESYDAIAKSLAEELQGLGDLQIQVVATTRKPVAVNGRVLRCFKKRIEMPIPTEVARFDILQNLTSYTVPAAVIQSVAERTPAFIAEDLHLLCEEALEHAELRAKTHSMDAIKIPIRRSSTQFKADNINPLTNEPSSTVTSQKPRVELLPEDFTHALDHVHPSIMSEAYIEVPKVRWSDIGGSEEVKRKLDEVLGFPIRHTDAMSAFQLDTSSGVLLYGPPGCSKTLTAKAVATESGRNFIAVKGPELISKYVGESEYKIREVFRKARDASPSVIFFDEIDSIAPERDSGASHEGLNTVNALLNEMDGIEASKGVLVLAATNRPEAIDPALLRPQRLGTLVYMGPPNFAARRQILAMKTQGRRPGPDLNINRLAEKTEGYSGADVVELCRLAAYEAAKEFAVMPDREKGRLEMRHFYTALEEMRPSLSEEVVEKLESWQMSGVAKMVVTR